MRRHLRVSSRLTLRLRLRWRLLSSAGQLSLEQVSFLNDKRGAARALATPVCTRRSCDAAQRKRIERARHSNLLSLRTLPLLHVDFDARSRSCQRALLRATTGVFAFLRSMTRAMETTTKKRPIDRPATRVRSSAPAAAATVYFSTSRNATSSNRFEKRRQRRLALDCRVRSRRKPFLPPPLI